MPAAAKPNLKGEFARQLRRASAKKGALDPVYRELSDVWTSILQKLYPVWALVGPGLSDPAHIEIHSSTVYLDSNALLGSREEIVAGGLDRYRVLVCMGAALHETLHAKHTKRWFIEYNVALDDETLAEDRRLLEEPRMEATGCRDFPAESIRGRFLRRALAAAVSDVVLADFTKDVAVAAALGQPVTRDMAGKAMTYLQARTHYGVVDPTTLGLLMPIWKQVLGVADIAALDDLYARLLYVPDGDNAMLDSFATEYRKIIGPPDPAPPTPAAGEDQGNGASAGTGQDDGSDQQQPARSLADALETITEQQRQAQRRQLEQEGDIRAIADAAAGRARNTGTGTGGTRGGRADGRLPDRGVDRPPHPDEIRMAVQYATELAKARAIGIKRIDKQTPGGRFNARRYVRGIAQRRNGQPVTSHPWEVQLDTSAPIDEPHVAIIVDSSGSMRPYEYALGPAVWVIAEGLRDFNGKAAVALFGGATGMLTDGSTPLKLVPGITTGGGTQFAGDAIVATCEHLDMTNPRRPRFLYVISDGDWYDSEQGTAKIRELAEQGVPAVHIGIGKAPLSVEAERIVVIDDPADAMTIIARDTVEALKARRRRR